MGSARTDITISVRAGNVAGCCVCTDIDLSKIMRCISLQKYCKTIPVSTANFQVALRLATSLYVHSILRH